MVGLLALLAGSTSVRADLTNVAYGSLRFAVQATDAEHDAPGPRNYGSRAGLRSELVGFPGIGDTDTIVHFEAGGERDEVELTQRLFYGAFSGAWGEIGYGKQWTAFYNTVGRYMDVGLDRSGLAYLGSLRHADTLRYSNSYRNTYFELDAIRDPRSDGGFSRWQAGIDYQGPVFQVSLAVDLGQGSGVPLRETLAVTGTGGLRSQRTCGAAGVDCAGISLGWRVREYSAQLGAHRAISGRDHANAAALSLQFRPAGYAYYLELGYVDGPGSGSRSLAGGLQYPYGPHLSSFVEFSLIERTGAGNDFDDYVVGVGMRIDFEKML